MRDSLLTLIELQVERAGLAIRGGFQPIRQDGVPPMPDGTSAGTLILLGWTGGRSWPAFAGSPEAADYRPDPLDRWSRRVIDALAATFDAVALYPFGVPPWHPFQRWATKAERVFQSPLRLLVHPEWGLWHSYRGAIALRETLELPHRPATASPCEGCAAKPCLGACPVGAFTAAGYDVEACAAHLRSPEGADCRSFGCLARRACPVGRDHAYGPDEAAFYMEAFVAARARGS